MTRIVTAALAALFAAAPAYAADAPKTPVVIEAPEGAKQGPVKFAHENHAKVECAKCHTDKANDKAVPAVTNVKAGDTKGPAHDLCLNCHKENKAKATCTACHEKKAA